MNNTKYPRTNHFGFSNSKTPDDKTTNDYSVFEKEEVVIGEKLDGQNSGWNKYNVFARSHATPSELPWDKPIIEIHNRIKNRIGNDEFVFGESMVGIHSIEYKKLESYYYIFGVRVKDEWLSWDDVEDYAYCLDLPTVPILFKGKINDIKTKVLNLMDKPSTFDGYDTITGEETMEGVVVRSRNSFNDNNFNDNVIKMVREGHVKTDEHWTRNWKKAELIWHQ